MPLCPASLTERNLRPQRCRTPRPSRSRAQCWSSWAGHSPLILRRYGTATAALMTVSSLWCSGLPLLGAPTPTLTAATLLASSLSVPRSPLSRPPERALLAWSLCRPFCLARGFLLSILFFQFPLQVLSGTPTAAGTPRAPLLLAHLNGRSLVVVHLRTAPLRTALLGASSSPASFLTAGLALRLLLGAGLAP